MQIFEYKGYVSQAALDDQWSAYLGEVINIDDTICFIGRSPEDAKKAFQNCIDLYLSVCKKRGILPQKPAIPKMSQQ